MVWQTLFLNLYWMTYLAFFIDQGVSSINSDVGIRFCISNPSFLSNALATLGNVFLICHDWLFAEQYVLATLNLPIALKICGPNMNEMLSRNNELDLVSEVQGMKVKAKRKSRLLRGFFYSSVTAYAILTIVYKNFTLRL